MSISLIFLITVRQVAGILVLFLLLGPWSEGRREGMHAYMCMHACECLFKWQSVWVIELTEISPLTSQTYFYSPQGTKSALYASLSEDAQTDTSKY